MKIQTNRKHSWKDLLQLSRIQDQLDNVCHAPTTNHGLNVITRIKLQNLELEIWIKEEILVFVVKFFHLTAFEILFFEVAKLQVCPIHLLSYAKISQSMGNKPFLKVS